MKIYIVRHGETEANLTGLMQGQSESDLTDFGRLLAKKTGLGLKDINFDIAYVSPLRRTQETAKIIISENKNPNTKIILNDKLKEIYLGIWEGKPFKGPNSIIKPEDVKSFFINPFNFLNVYKGEITNDVIKRTKAFLDDLVTKDYENVLVVSHGYAIRAMLNFMYDNPADFWQGGVPLNCAVNIIEYKDKSFKFIAKDKIYYDNNDRINRFTLK